MTTRIELPPGCYGLECADGTKYDGKPGTHVNVEDHHADAIGKSRHAHVGLLSPSRSFRLATKAGRRCPDCHFSAQAWTTVCPRCSTPTEEEMI